MKLFKPKKRKVKYKNQSKITNKNAPIFKIKERYTTLELPSGRTESVFKITNKYGANRIESGIGWFSKLLPIATRVADSYMVERVQRVGSAMTDDIQEKRLGLQGMPDTKDTKEISGTKNRNEDNALIAQELAQQNALVASDAFYVARANESVGVDLAVKNQRARVNDLSLTGLHYTRTPARQISWVRQMFAPFAITPFVFLEPSTVYSQRMALVSGGFNDKNGTIIGQPLQFNNQFNPSTVSLMDLNRFKNQVVIGGSKSFHPLFSAVNYENGKQIVSYENVKGASLVAQNIANEAWIQGRRIHHIVLDSGINSGNTPFWYSNDAMVFDMANKSLNAMEVYGKWETVQQDVDLTFQKITDMLVLLAGGNIDPLVTTALRNQILHFFLTKAQGTGMWSEQPELESAKAKQILVNKKTHANYPKLSDLNSMFTNAITKNADNQDVAKGLQQIQNSLKNALATNRKLFGETTTLPDEIGKEHNQIYYDLSKINANDDVLQAEFLNVLAYVSATARANVDDVVVIHNADMIRKDVVPMIKNIAKRLHQRNIRIVWAFDENGISSDEKITALDNKGIYGNLQNDTDYFIMGSMDVDGYTALDYALGNTLPPNVKDDLTNSKAKSVAFISRRADGINSSLTLELGV